MRGSLRLGTAFGIPVFMHWSFLGLLGFVALSRLFATGSLAVALNGVIFIAVIFGCVVLHEFGHVLAARRYGIGTQDVTLLPIGGIARLDRMPEDPRQELVVALAGPAVNVAIAGLLAGWLLFTGAISSALGAGVIGGSFAASLLSVNIALVVFNLLPAFPMDGGRVLRALLARKIGYLPATEIAATIGRGMAMLFGVAGLFWNPMLIFVAIFVWFGAGQEAAVTRRRAVFGGQDPGVGRTGRPQGPTIEGEIIEGEIVDAPPPTARGRVQRVGPVWIYREE